MSCLFRKTEKRRTIPPFEFTERGSQRQGRHSGYSFPSGMSGCAASAKRRPCLIFEEPAVSASDEICGIRKWEWRKCGGCRVRRTASDDRCRTERQAVNGAAGAARDRPSIPRRDSTHSRTWRSCPWLEDIFKAESSSSFHHPCHSASGAGNRDRGRHLEMLRGGTRVFHRRDLSRNIRHPARRSRPGRLRRQRSDATAWFSIRRWICDSQHDRPPTRAGGNIRRSQLRRRPARSRHQAPVVDQATHQFASRPFVKQPSHRTHPGNFPPRAGSCGARPSEFRLQYPGNRSQSPPHLPCRPRPPPHRASLCRTTRAFGMVRFLNFPNQPPDRTVSCDRQVSKRIRGRVMENLRLLWTSKK